MNCRLALASPITYKRLACKQRCISCCHFFLPKNLTIIIVTTSYLTERNELTRNTSVFAAYRKKWLTGQLLHIWHFSFVLFFSFFCFSVRSGRKQLASIVNFLLSVVATFAFGYVASQYAFPSEAVRVLIGLSMAFAVAIAELYFMARVEIWLYLYTVIFHFFSFQWSFMS